MPDLTVIRGHLAEEGSPAEVYLVAWAEADEAARRLETEAHGYAAWAVRESDRLQRLARVDTVGRTRAREGYEARGPCSLRNMALELEALARPRREVADWLHLLATTSPGYRGEDNPAPTGA